IGLHCWSHDYYYTKNPEKYEEEVYQGAEAIKKSIGVWPTLMRPPGGNITEEQYKSCEFPVIIWSIDTEDWKHKKNTDENPKSENIQTIVRNALYGGKEATEANFKVKNGDIILMHEIYENSYDAFCIIIEELHNRGFEFVTVSELLQNPAPGCKYYSATYKKG
ncbi:MAG: polysaccharide deacetylase family protein, partial [Clostridia bacterium]|nr:polysaccharide deacetylase family protein [Clostridia bacterium]